MRFIALITLIYHPNFCGHRLNQNFLERLKDFFTVIEPTNTASFGLKFHHTVGCNKVSFEFDFYAPGRLELYNLFGISSDLLQVHMILRKLRDTHIIDGGDE